MDEPNEQLRSYSPPADPLPVRDPRPDLSNEGNGPTVVTTIVGTQPLLDGFGNPILDGYGNPILIPGPVLLIGADPERTILQFAMPPNFGMFINPLGGDASNPSASGTEFLAPGSSYQAFGEATQLAVNYFITIAGLTIVVETQNGGVLY